MFSQRVLLYLIANNTYRHLSHNVKCNKLVSPCILNRSILSNTITQPQNQTYVLTRSYAKGKDKKKDTKGKAKIQVNESQLSKWVNIDSYKSNLQKPLDVLKQEFTKHLSLRSTTGSIESIQINVDGKEHLLQEVAQIVRKNPKTIVVNMAIFPQAIPAVLKALQKSGMNLSPQQEGTTLYIPVPKVTKEHRENLSKNAKALFVKCRDSMKDAQNKLMKDLKRKEGISQDVQRQAEQQIVQIADDFVQEAEKILDSKQTELVGKDNT